jgi:diguanylate cyclase (GGDEF)-like protein/PAS domain S-box-containing protein
MNRFSLRTWLRTKFSDDARAETSETNRAEANWTVLVSGRTVRQPGADFLGAIVESSDDAIVGSALDGTVLSWNGAAERLYGYTAEEMLGQSISVLMPPDRSDELPTLFARLVAGEQIDNYETVRQRKDGSLVDVSVTISPIRDESGRIAGVSAIARDISKRKRVEKLIEHQAFHDPLTDLPNRVLLYDRIKGALARAQRSGAFVAILFLDLDDFKLVNDRHGHTTGDRVLRMLGPRLQAVIRPDDTLARFGGDEFVIVCADIHSEAVAATIATRINQALAAPFDVGGTEISVTASVGVTLGAPDDDADELLGEADAAMYSTKIRDRSRIRIFEVNREQTGPDTTTAEPQ